MVSKYIIDRYNIGVVSPRAGALLSAVAAAGLTALSGQAAAQSGAGVTTRAVICTAGSSVRKLEIVSPGVRGRTCDVKQTYGVGAGAPVKRPYYANNSLSYCNEKFELIAGRLGESGFACSNALAEALNGDRAEASETVSENASAPSTVAETLSAPAPTAAAAAAEAPIAAAAVAAPSPAPVTSSVTSPATGPAIAPQPATASEAAESLASADAETADAAEIEVPSPSAAISQPSGSASDRAREAQRRAPRIRSVEEILSGARPGDQDTEAQRNAEAQRTAEAQRKVENSEPVTPVRRTASRGPADLVADATAARSSAVRVASGAGRIVGATPEPVPDPEPVIRSAAASDVTQPEAVAAETDSAQLASNDNAQAADQSENASGNASGNSIVQRFEREKRRRREAENAQQVAALAPEAVRENVSVPRFRPTQDVIRSVINAQAAAWNEGDLNAFMEGYWKSPNMRFVSGTDVTSGWAQTLRRYQDRYRDGGPLGVLSFRDLEVEMVTNDVAVVVGRYNLDDGGARDNGVFTLVMRRFDGAWRIVHDHTVAGR
ncbi:MAG: nuclear transport factor 2 family protein [Pseudomonadota bacterium]